MYQQYRPGRHFTLRHAAGLAITSAAILAASAATPDYSAGVFFVNEDWFGHSNSSLNHLSPDDPDGDYWHYRVFREANPGHEIGCTSQFGTIWHDRFYIISKQAQDQGSSIMGGRLTIFDATDLHMMHQSELIDNSVDPDTGRHPACDGRAFVGIDARKGYISTSSGIWPLNLDTYEIGPRIEGTASTGLNIYRGQCGNMVYTAGRLFAAHQQYGLLVIDPATDTLIATIPMTMVDDRAGIGSLVLSKDGNLWLSVAKNTSGNGAALNLLIKVDPVSLTTTTVNLPDGISGPSNSWYAWTPDSFCASQSTNTLFWSGSDNSWFAGTKIFRYDIDTDTYSLWIDLDDNLGWKLYGCSMRVDPRTDELYMSLYQDFSKQDYIVRRYAADGTLKNEYPMIANYWFPSIPVFPGSTDADNNDQNSISDVGRVNAGITLTDNTLHLEGLAGETLMIYGIDGSVRLSMRITDDEQSVSLALPAGIYIARCGATVLKFKHISKNRYPL